MWGRCWKEHRHDLKQMPAWGLSAPLSVRGPSEFPAARFIKFTANGRDLKLKVGRFLSGVRHVKNWGLRSLDQHLECPFCAAPSRCPGRSTFILQLQLGGTQLTPGDCPGVSAALCYGNRGPLKMLDEPFAPESLVLIPGHASPGGRIWQTPSCSRSGQQTPKWQGLCILTLPLPGQTLPAALLQGWVSGSTWVPSPSPRGPSSQPVGRQR